MVIRIHSDTSITHKHGHNSVYKHLVETTIAGRTSSFPSSSVVGSVASYFSSIQTNGGWIALLLSILRELRHIHRFSHYPFRSVATWIVSLFILFPPVCFIFHYTLDSFHRDLFAFSSMLVYVLETFRYRTLFFWMPLKLFSPFSSRLHVSLIIIYIFTKAIKQSFWSRLPYPIIRCYMF